MTPRPSYVFDIAVHARPAGLPEGAAHDDARGRWATLTVPGPLQSEPFAISFDVALDQLGGLERMFVEPDGALLWTASVGRPEWQVDGNAWERDGRLLRVDLHGTCPADAFDRLLEACGWPAQAIMVQLMRAGVFLDEPTFRRHAATRVTDGPGETLRPA
jgi:hypothetical protein